MDHSCFSCGATQRDLTEVELDTYPRRDVEVCADCAGLYRAAGLIAPQRTPLTSQPGANPSPPG